jgi:hypothetical protein
MLRDVASVIVLVGALACMPPAAFAQEWRPSTRVAWLDGPTWYAVAGSYRMQRKADARAQRLGEPWIVQNSNICDNFAPVLWVVVAGAYDGQEAKRLALRVGGYAKECN